MRQLVYQVALGDRQPFWDRCIASVAEYCRRHGFDHEVQREPVLRVRPRRSARSANALRFGYLPIYEKENAFSYLDRYAEVAVIDADVFARPSAPSIFEALAGADFGAVAERDMPLTGTYADKIRKHSEGHFRPLADVDWRWNERGAEFYNMGVMVLGEGFRQHLDGQTPGEFLARPEFAPFVNGEGAWRWSTDQSLLNWWVKRTGMTVRNLDWRWNALYGAVRDVAPAHFVHFFLAAKMPERGAEIPRLIERL